MSGFMGLEGTLHAAEKKREHRTATNLSIRNGYLLCLILQCDINTKTTVVTSHNLIEFKAHSIRWRHVMPDTAL